MSGEIRRIGNNPTPTRKGPIVLGQNEIQSEPQILDKNSKPGPTPTEVRVHEEILVEGEDKIRRRKSDDGLGLRFRAGKDREAWDRVKRLEDE
jgi:hypothetical protein